MQGLTGIAEHPWAYPALEVAHIIGIALLLGNLLIVELRFWGLAQALPMRPLARLGLSIAVAGFLLAAGSGLLMFAAAPAELLANRLFVLKLVLLTAAGVNAVVFHARGGFDRADAVGRVQTVLSLGLWLAVIMAGRFIAYL